MYIIAHGSQRLTENRQKYISVEVWVHDCHLPQALEKRTSVCEIPLLWRILQSYQTVKKNGENVANISSTFSKKNFMTSEILLHISSPILVLSSPIKKYTYSFIPKDVVLNSINCDTKAIGQLESENQEIRIHIHDLSSFKLAFTMHTFFHKTQSIKVWTKYPQSQKYNP